MAWNPELGDTAAERKQRRSFLFKVDCANEEGHLVQVRVRNLSATGMGAVSETGLGFLDGEAVWVNFEGIRKVAGKVIWVKGKSFGVTFNRTVDPDYILAKLPRPGKDFVVDPRHQMDSKYRRPGLLEQDV